MLDSVLNVVSISFICNLLYRKKNQLGNGCNAQHFDRSYTSFVVLKCCCLRFYLASHFGRYRDLNFIISQNVAA